MDIVIIANFCGDFSEDDNGRFAYLCKELSKKHNVEVITSDFYHALKKHRNSLNIETPYKVTFLHESGYSSNISLTRFYSHFVWGCNIRKYLQKRKKPDVIYSAFPSLTGPFFAAKYCKKNKIKYIVDIQDLWPEAFKIILNVPLLNDIVFYPLTRKENYIYTSADKIVAVSNTYANRALKVNKKCADTKAVFIGTDLGIFDKGASREPFYPKNENEILIGYCGSLAASYDIPNFLYAIKQLSEKGIKNVKAIIMGDGTHRQRFEAIAESNNINAVFTGALPYNKMCAQLKNCDIVVNPIKKNSVASIINKHGDYAASGLAVVNSQESFEYRNLIDEYQMGINCKNEDFADMADAFEKLIVNPELRIQMGKNARRCAEEKFDRRLTYKEIIDLFEK